MGRAALPSRAAPVLTALLLVAAGQAVAAATDGAVRLRHAVVRRVVEGDPGTVECVVENPSTAPCLVSDVCLGAVSVKKLTPNVVMWWDVVPNPTPPHGYSRVVVRLSRAWTWAPMTVTVAAEGGEVGSAVEPASAAPFEAITFDLDRNLVYAYLRSPPQATAPKSVCLDGAALPPEAWSCREAGADRLWAVAAKPPARLISGNRYLVEVDPGVGPTQFGFAQCRSGFPILPQGSVPAPATLGFDDRPLFSEFNPADVRPSTDREPCFLLAGDPVCHDMETHSWVGSAPEIVKRAQMARAKRPAASTFVLVSFPLPNLSYLCYGQIADLLGVNPYRFAAPGHDPLANRSWYALARRAQAPGPFLAMCEAFQPPGWRRPDHNELRAAVHAAVAAGAKGLIYYTAQGEDGFAVDPELCRAIAVLNAELRPLRGLLAIGCPARSAVCESAGVDVECIVAGHEGIVVFPFDTAFAGPRRTAEEHLTPRVLHDVPLRVSVPAGLKVESVKFGFPNAEPLRWESQPDRAIAFRLPRLQVCSPCLVSFAQAP